MNSTGTPTFGSRATRSKPAGKSRITILAHAIETFGDAGPDVRDTRVGGGEQFTPNQARIIARSPALKRYLKQILLRVGNRWMERVIARTKQLDLIGRPLSHTIHLWRVKLYSTNGGQFDNRVGLTNPTPWLIYEHPKGTPKDRTFLRTDMPPLAKAAAAELEMEIRAFKSSPGFRRAVKAALLAGMAR